MRCTIYLPEFVPPVNFTKILLIYFVRSLTLLMFSFFSLYEWKDRQRQWILSGTFSSYFQCCLVFGWRLRSWDRTFGWMYIYFSWGWEFRGSYSRLPEYEWSRHIYRKKIWQVSVYSCLHWTYKVYPKVTLKIKICKINVLNKNIST